MMRRADLYLKLELELDDRDDTRKLADELCRLLMRSYGVRLAEVSNIIEQD
jgi:hypothetical protein